MNKLSSKIAALQPIVRSPIDDPALNEVSHHNFEPHISGLREAALLPPLLSFEQNGELTHSDCAGHWSRVALQVRHFFQGQRRAILFLAAA